MTSKFRISSTLIVLAVIAILVAGKAVWLARDDGSPFLTAPVGADWIQADEPYFLGARGRETAETFFQTHFSVAAGAAAPPLTVCAMRDAAVYIDGKLVLPFSKTLSGWKRGRTISLTQLPPGEHTLVVLVVNSNGPALLLAHSSALGLATDSSWKAARNGADWAAALAADASRLPEIALRFGSPGASLRRLAPALAVLFSIAFFIFYADMKNVIRAPSPSQWRWLLIVAWAALAIHNIAKIPPQVGADVESHLEYILYVAAHWRVPFIYEGWEMHQAPLYYFISALFYTVLRIVGFAASATTLLRLIPLACGAAQVEMVYRAGKSAFPESSKTQAWVTVLGGLLPMNLYVSQTVGNDPPFALLSSLVLLWGMKRSEERSPVSSRDLLLAGVLLGLALLTKALAILLVPILALRIFQDAKSRSQAASRFILVFGTAFILSAWFYLRNFLVLGSFYVGTWNAASHMVVWQSPGYWTWSQFLRFGRALSRPIFAATAGYWDAIYSTLWLDGSLSARYDAPPPWRYDFMLVGSWLALIPTAAILTGTARAALAKRAHGALQFCVQSAAVFLGGWFLLFYLAVPAYGSARYLLGSLSCLAVLGGAGVERMTRTRLVGSLVGAWLVCWAVCAYAAYWV